MFQDDGFRLVIYIYYNGSGEFGVLSFLAHYMSFIDCYVIHILDTYIQLLVEEIKHFVYYIFTLLFRYVLYNEVILHRSLLLFQDVFL